MGFGTLPEEVLRQLNSALDLIDDLPHTFPNSKVKERVLEATLWLQAGAASAVQSTPTDAAASTAPSVVPTAPTPAPVYQPPITPAPVYQPPITENETPVDDPGADIPAAAPSVAVEAPTESPTTDVLPRDIGSDDDTPAEAPADPADPAEDPAEDTRGEQSEGSRAGVLGRLLPRRDT